MNLVRPDPDKNRCQYMMDVGNNQHVLMLTTRKAYSDPILLKGLKAGARPLAKAALEKLLRLQVSTAGGVAAMIDHFSLASIVGTFQAQLMGFYRCCICEETSYGDNIKWGEWKWYNEAVSGSGIDGGRDVYHPHLAKEFKTDFDAAVQRAFDTIEEDCKAKEE